MHIILRGLILLNFSYKSKFCVHKLSKNSIIKKYTKNEHIRP